MSNVDIKSIFRESIKQLNLQVIKFILSNYPNEIYNDVINFCLQQAVLHSRLDITKYITDNHSNIITDDTINYSLQLACKNNTEYTKYTKYMIYYLFYNYSKIVTSYTISLSLCYASQNGALCLVKYLLTNFSDKIDHYAIRDSMKNANDSKHFDVIKRLNEYNDSEVTVTLSREDYIKVKDIVTVLEAK